MVAHHSLHERGHVGIVSFAAIGGASERLKVGAPRVEVGDHARPAASRGEEEGRGVVLGAVRVHLRAELDEHASDGDVTALRGGVQRGGVPRLSRYQSFRITVPVPCLQYSGDAVLVADPARADHHGGGDFGARAGEVLHRSQRSRRVAERLHRRGVVPERPQLVLVLVRGQVPGVVGFGSSVGFGFGGFRGVVGPRRSFRDFGGILGAGRPERGFRRLVALLGKVHDDVRGVPRRCFDGRGAPVGRARVHVRAVLHE